MPESGDGFATPKNKEYLFEIQINGYQKAFAQKCNFGARKPAIVETWGGRGHAHIENGQTKFDPVVLNSVIPNEGPGKDFFENLCNQSYDPKIGRARTNRPHFEMTIIEFDDQHNPIRGWDYHECLIENYDLGDRDRANVDKASIEIVHIRYVFREQRIIS